MLIFYKCAKPKAWAFHQPCSQKTPAGCAVRSYCFSLLHTICKPSLKLSQLLAAGRCCESSGYYFWAGVNERKQGLTQNADEREESQRCFAAQYSSRRRCIRGRSLQEATLTAFSDNIRGNYFRHNPDNPGHLVFSNLPLYLTQAQNPTAHPACVGGSSVTFGEFSAPRNLIISCPNQD